MWCMALRLVLEVTGKSEDENDDENEDDGEPFPRLQNHGWIASDVACSIVRLKGTPIFLP